MGSLRVFLSVKGNKGKDNDIGSRERVVETVMGKFEDEKMEVVGGQDSIAACH